MLLLLLCIFFDAADYMRILLIIMASAFFHSQSSLSLMLYILSVLLDGKCPVFDCKQELT